MDKEYFILVKGSGEEGHINSADAVLRIYQEDVKLKEEIYTDEDDLLSCLSSKKTYMSYLSAEDIADYIRKDGGRAFYSVRVISAETALKVKEDPYNWE